MENENSPSYEQTWIPFTHSYFAKFHLSWPNRPEEDFRQRRDKR